MSARPPRVPPRRSKGTCSSLRTIAPRPGRYALAMRIARFSHSGEVSYGLVLGPDGPAGETGGPADGTGTASGTGSINGSGVNGSGVYQRPAADQILVAPLAGHSFGGPAEDIELNGVPYPLAPVCLLS